VSRTRSRGLEDGFSQLVCIGWLQLGPIPYLPLDGIDWAIVGGESGANHRPIDATWVRDIHDQTSDASTCSPATVMNVRGPRRSSTTPQRSERADVSSALFFAESGRARHLAGHRSLEPDGQRRMF